MQNHAPTIYGYPNLNALFDGEVVGGKKIPLPGAAGQSGDRAPGQEITRKQLRARFIPAW